MIIKAICVIWLLFTLISENKSPRTEKVSIAHMAISFYVTWSVFMGSWELPGRWEKVGLIVDSMPIAIAGWSLFALSIIYGLRSLAERQTIPTYNYLLLSSWIVRHRQIGYFFALLGTWLVAYSGGYYKVPFHTTFLIFLFNTIQDEAVEQDRKKEQSQKVS